MNHEAPQNYCPICSSASFCLINLESGESRLVKLIIETIITIYGSIIFIDYELILILKNKQMSFKYFSLIKINEWRKVILKIYYN